MVCALMAIFFSNDTLLAKNLTRTSISTHKIDTIKRVSVRVVALERPTNYDSIFRSQSSHFKITAKHTTATPAVKPQRKIKSNTSGARDVFSPKQRSQQKNSQSTPRQVMRETQLQVTKARPPAKATDNSKQATEQPKSEVVLAATKTNKTGLSNDRKSKLPNDDDLFSNINETESKTRLVKTENKGIIQAPSNPEPQKASVGNALEETIELATDSNQKLTDFSIENSPKANKISYMWIGFVLVLAGVVLGLVFGRTAFMVSVVGFVFLIIGFYI